MNENQNVDIDREQDNGQITYANEVISTIVSVATTEVDGISAIAGNSGLLGKGKLPRGVRVDMNGEDVSVDVSVTVDYGMPIQKVGRSAQENVRKSIESMTGLHVEKVDLHVVGVSFEKESKVFLISATSASAFTLFLSASRRSFPMTSAVIMLSSIVRFSAVARQIPAANTLRLPSGSFTVCFIFTTVPTE